MPHITKFLKLHINSPALQSPAKTIFLACKTFKVLNHFPSLSAKFYALSLILF